MSLDIRFSVENPIICPHCGKVVDSKSIDFCLSGGQIWHDFLRKIGGDLPYETDDIEVGRFGEDYILTKNEVYYLLTFLSSREAPCDDEVKRLAMLTVANAHKGYALVVNADW